MSKESNKDFFQFALKKAVQEEETRIIEKINKIIEEYNIKMSNFVNKEIKQISNKHNDAIKLIKNISEEMKIVHDEYRKAIKGYNRVIEKYNKLSKLLGGNKR